MSYVGIDYGGGKTNIDRKTGIRFGVISMHLLPYWPDEREWVYSNACPLCGNEPKSGNNIHNMKRCPSCYGKLGDDAFQEENPIIGFKIDDGEYKAFQSHDDTDIFIKKSPYYTYAQFCSPCAPGACHLENPLDGKVENNRCYCFGHDAFEDVKAPYPVYSLETGEEIFPV